MKMIQLIRVKDTEVVGLGCCETIGLIRLRCGSTLLVDMKILKRLLTIFESERDFLLETHND